ncbi:M56 family metallopeptidase [uncultured Dysosmobacter sp.]|uniref:M56 family metallopeptidase n=1 Tax=uncultured Dysosmobacter sp. TaxID=2591384 RepID=UPI0026191669|nr:M56 family metallopeptidase [uncultured Dysosmobacter sp.]
MELLTAIFQKLLSMALSALPVMAVVLLARCLLRQAPKKYSYWLWCVVGFRLVCPEAVISRSPWSIFNLRPLQSVAEATQSVQNGALPAVQAAPISPSPAVTVLAPELESGGAEAVRTALSAGEIALRAGAVLWLIGMAALLAYSAVSYIRLRRRMAAAVWEGGEIWACGSISTPFVMGFVRPRIYIPFRLDSSQRTYVLAHERYHIRRRDHWVKLLAYLILAVYWWDPAAWLCWRLFCRDMEMRCDEAVLARLGDQVKKGYSLSLVSFALDRRGPMVLAFGEHDASRRVKNVLNWKRETPRVVFLAVALVVLVAAVCGTNGKSRPDRWVRLAETGEEGEQTFTYSVAERYRSCLLYQEIYDRGVLAERKTLGAWSLGEDAGNTSGTALAREGTARLLAVFDGYGIQWSFGAAAADGGEGGASIGVRLSGRQYSGMAWNSLCDNTEKGRVALEEDTAVAAAALTEDTLHTFGIQPGTDTWMEELLRNDTAVVLRLRLSELGTAELKEAFARESGGLAQTLYDLRDGDIETLVTRLFQECPWELEPEQLTRCYLSPGTGDLFLMAEQAASGDLDQAANCALLLLALREDVSKVIFDVKLRTGSQETGMGWRVTEDAAEAAQDLAELGASETDIRRYGASPEALRELLAYLNWGSGAEADLARTLYAGRGDPEALLSAMEDFEEPLGRWELQEAAGNYLSLLFYDSPVAAEKRSTLMWRYSMVLLALLDDYAATTWNWIDGGVQALTPNDGLWNTDPWLHAHGLAGSIRDYGASPQAVETLLEALYPQNGGGAPVSELGASLFALRGETALLVKAIPERLIGLNGWNLTEDGVLELSVSGTLGGIADSGEELLSNASCLLAALLPEEVWAISWTVDGRPVQFSYVGENDPPGDLFTESTAFTWTEHRSGGGLYVRSCGQSAAGMTLLLDALGIGGESLPVQTAETFTDILGYDGFLWQEQWDRWSLRTYYAVTAEGTFPIAESFGWGGREDYSVDLNGDGQKELVCNVTFNADGARRAYVYQRRDGGIWQSCVTPEGLPDYEYTGIGSSWEEYDPAENLFRIHYHKTGQEDYAVAEIQGMEQMEEFYPYS